MHFSTLFTLRRRPMSDTLPNFQPEPPATQEPANPVRRRRPAKKVARKKRVVRVAPPAAEEPAKPPRKARKTRVAKQRVAKRDRPPGRPSISPVMPMAIIREIASSHLKENESVALCAAMTALEELTKRGKTRVVAALTRLLP
jgi:hypothetical protein